jgi:hypothetical protein
MRLGNAPENASPICTGYIGQVKELARKESANVAQDVVIFPKARANDMHHSVTLVLVGS